MPHMEGIFINGEKAKFHPEDILDTDASQYTEEIGESVTAYLTEHLTNPSNPPIDTSLTISGAAADAKETGDQISQLKSDLLQTTDKVDALENAYNTAVVETATGAVCSFADGGDGLPMKSLVVNIDPVQSGSGDPSPDNVRPISGWSEVNVNACGVNVWDGTYEAGKWIDDPSTGVVTNVGSGYNLTGYIPVVPGLTYYGRTTGSSRATWFDANKNALGQCIHNQNDTFTVPANARYVRFTITDAYLDDFYINYPSTDHDYHPYDGQSINIALGQTVYGGKLDVLSGVLTVTRALLTLNSATMNNASTYPGWKNSGIRALIGTGINTEKTMQINVGNVVGINTSGASTDIIYMPIASYGNLSQSDWIALALDVQFIVPLATPTTVQLTPHQVATLLGANNIFADCGDVTAEYRADTGLYIESLTEPDADMVADANITSGQYFMVGNTLYKATANIASGATISPNVNCTRKSLSEALNEINA